MTFTWGIVSAESREIDFSASNSERRLQNLEADSQSFKNADSEGKDERDQLPPYLEAMSFDVKMDFNYE